MPGYYKAENDQLIKAPHNIGNVCNADQDAALMAANGYTWYSDEEKAAWDADHPLALPARIVFSKLAIRRAMRTLGLETQLDRVLTQQGTFAKDWADAQEIDLDDPVLKEGLIFAGLTTEQIRQIQVEAERNC